MKMRSVVRSLFCTGLVAWCAAGLPAVAADDPAWVGADRALVLAVSRGSTNAAVNLLDADVTWTDADGRTLSKGQVAQALPTPAIGDETVAEVRRFDYGKVAVVEIDRARLHALRVWVQRSAGWRLLVYQEIRSLDAPPTVTPGTGAECDNPCRRLPYEPKSANERGVVSAYQSLETSAHAADAAHWGDHVADEFVLVSSNSDRSMDKATRIAGLRKASKGGVSPTRLISAQMVDMGDAVVMRSRHEPDKGSPLQITRVWVKRNNVWMATLSYQTSIAKSIAK
jgi:uncharacterized protein DUF4440